MKITDVRFIPLVVPLKTPLPLSFGLMTKRCSGLIEVHTDEGLVGRGESWVNFPSWAIHERRYTVEEGLKPILLGRDPLTPAPLRDLMIKSLTKVTRQWGAVGPVFQAIAGAEIALWDLAGRALGLPVWKMLGGTRPERIPVYASGLGPDLSEETAARCVEAGFKGVKVKVGFDRDRDLDNIRRLRGAVGSDAAIMIDANQAFTVDEAIYFGRAAADYDILWFEEPVPVNDFAALGRVAKESGIPIAAGENAYTSAEFCGLIDPGGVAIVQPDVTKAGGIIGGKSACEMALSAGRRFAPHYFAGAVGLAATLHLFAATPGGMWVELDVTSNSLREELLLEPISITDGFASVPRGPGLGIELDPMAVQRFRSV